MIQENFRYTTEKQATLIETLGGIETLKSMAAESTQQRRWERAICHASKLGARLHFLSNTSVNFSMFAQHMGTVLVIIAGVYQIGAGKMTIGALIACTILTGRALAPMVGIAGLIMRYHQSKLALESVDKVMHMPLERPPEKRPLEYPKLQGHIEFRDVSFTYPEQEMPALQNISFSIKPGERVALIGRIGSGKTTIEKLLLGLYQPTQGSILLDGTAIQQYDPADLRRDIGYVPQDIMLFYGSIKDNIVLRAPYISDQAILQAANVSCVGSFVKQHPSGFDRQVGERGSQLSGGQRQTIAIARALLLDPPILVMDEPTNTMDDHTELHFKQRFSTYLTKNATEEIKGKTLLLITHRRSMLALIDRVIVIDNGHVVANGPRDKVLTALAEGKIKMPKS